MAKVHPGADAAQAARALAADLRGPPRMHTLGLATASRGPGQLQRDRPAVGGCLADLYDAVARGAESMGCAVARAELVGLGSRRHPGRRAHPSLAGTRPLSRGAPIGRADRGSVG